MEFVSDLYAAQPFWIWLAIGVILLAVEAAFSTEWLLWPAVSAGVVAVLTALGLRVGLPVEVVIFAALTVASTLLSGASSAGAAGSSFPAPNGPPRSTAPDRPSARA